MPSAGILTKTLIVFANLPLFSETVTFVNPAPTPVMVPLESTFATVVSWDIHLSVLSSVVSSGSYITVTVYDSPLLSCSSCTSGWIPRRGEVTVTVQLSEYEPYCETTVITAVPAPLAVTVPDELTEAI